MAVQINYTEFNSILLKLRTEYKIFAPVKLKGIGKSSKNDIIRYCEINDAKDIIFDEKSDFSPKEVYFPITQTLSYALNNDESLLEIDDKNYIIFMRPCDINAISIFNNLCSKDKQNGIFNDRLRKKIKIFMIECKEGFDTCFCVSMGMNKTDYYDMAFRFSSENILCEIKSEEFAVYFGGIGEQVNFTPVFVSKDRMTVHVPDVSEISNEMKDTSDWTEFLKRDGSWAEYTKRCISCGRCNFVCHTCVCFRVQDITYNDEGTVREKRRVWESCMKEGYSNNTGSQFYRRSSGDRMLFKVFHKI
ncbi:MAG TPA: 4Fe-4S dicluster domain-containing protein, partial [Clostridia bacterium]